MDAGRNVSPILALPPLPDGWLAHVERVADQTLGRFDAGGSELSEAVAAQSEIYNRTRGPREVPKGALAARLRFFLNRDLPKIEGPLAELALRRALPAARHWRVLDLGAGLGATTLGVARVARRLGAAERLLVTAVDADAEALRIMEALCADVSTLPGTAVHLSINRAELRSFLPGGVTEPQELIVVGMALNELDLDTAAAVEMLADLVARLAPDGVLVVVEPALRDAARALHRIRDHFALQRPDIHIAAPCLHRKPCPMLSRNRDWCHERLPGRLPDRLSVLARQAGLRSADLTYSFLALRRSPIPAGDAYRIVSGPLKTKGKLELRVCGAGDVERLMRLDRHASPANTSMEALGRGAVVRIPGDASGTQRVHSDTFVELVQYWHVDA